MKTNQQKTPEDSPRGDAWGGPSRPGKIFGRFSFMEVRDGRNGKGKI